MTRLTEAQAQRYLDEQLQYLEHLRSTALITGKPVDPSHFVDAYNRISEARAQLAKVQGKV